jgi:hypothetical protein
VLEVRKSIPKMYNAGLSAVVRTLKMKPYEVEVSAPAFPISSLRVAVCRDTRYGFCVGEAVGREVFTGGAVGAPVNRAVGAPVNTIVSFTFTFISKIDELAPASDIVELDSTSKMVASASAASTSV